jgi:hypothetical protein
MGDQARALSYRVIRRSQDIAEHIRADRERRELRQRNRIQVANPRTAPSE